MEDYNYLKNTGVVEKEIKKIKLCEKSEKEKSVLEYSNKILGILDKQELDSEEVAWITKETVSNFSNNVNPGFLEYRKCVTQKGQFASVEWRDSGLNTFMDVNKKEYIDCLGGFGIFNVGHRNPKVVKAVQDQLSRQGLNSQDLLDPLRGALAKMLAEITPGDLKYTFFGSSGTEAVEGALKLAKLEQGKKGKHHFIAAASGFHGKSLGSLSATAKGMFRKPFMPLVSGFKHVPYGDADLMYSMIKTSEIVGEDIAGIILEPIQGEGGVILPPKEYFAKVKQMCEDFDILLIVDEVQTGMGRTGEMFCMDHYGVAPDIMCLAKALGGGVMPIGAVIATEKVFSNFFPNPFIHSTTFGGNPLSCAAAIATINVLIEEELPKRAQVVGDYFLKALRNVAGNFPELVSEVRGRGLMIGMEFMSNEIGYEVAKGLFDRGILVAGTLINAKTLRIEPPLTIEISQCEKVCEAFADTLLKLKFKK